MTSSSQLQPSSQSNTDTASAVTPTHASSIQVSVFMENQAVLVAANEGAPVAEANTAEVIGTVSVIVAGPINAEQPDGTVRTLETGDPIYLKDTVSTTARSFIKITLKDGTEFQLGPLSRASMDKYAYQPEENDGEFESSVFGGLFRFVSGKIAGDNKGQHTTIKTPSATIGIRGSEIDARIHDDGSTTILHSSGLIDVLPAYSPTGFLIYEPDTQVFIPAEPAAPSIGPATETFVREFRGQLLPLNVGRVEERATEDLDMPASEHRGSSDFAEGEDSRGHEAREHEGEHEGLHENTGRRGESHEHGEHDNEYEEEDDLGGEGGEEFEGILPDEFLDAMPGMPTEPMPPDPEPPTIDIPAPGDVNIREDRAVIITPSGEVVDFTNGTNGRVVKNGDGSLSYTPIFGFLGSDRFTYTLADGTQVTEVLTIEPIIITATENENAAINDLTQPEHGRITDNGDGTLTYLPELDFSGNDSFSYRVEGSNLVTVNLSVLPVNDTPTAEPLNITTDEDMALLILATDLLPGPIDAEGDALSINARNAPDGLLAQSDNGNLLFTPLENFSGVTTFDFNIADTAGGEGASSTVSITVNPVNDAPQAINPTLEFTGLVNQPQIISVDTLLANMIDADGDPLTVSTISAVNNGTATLLGGGAVQFTPSLSNSNAGFDYTVSDGQGGTATARVNIMVGGNRTPMAQPDNLVVSGTAATVIPIATLLANDRDPDNDPLTLTAVDNAANGTTALSGSNITFTPNASFSNGSFTYTIDDGQGNTASGTVNLTRATTDDSLTVAFNSRVQIPTTTLLDNDAGSGLMVTSVDNASTGVTVSLTSPDTIDLLVDGLQSGNTASFDYTVIDANGVSDTATVMLSSNNLQAGTAGADVLTGSTGTDVLRGDAGNDILVSGGGNDILLGEAGDDMISFMPSAGAITIDGGTGNDTLKIDGRGQVLDLTANRSTMEFNLSNIEAIDLTGATGSGTNQLVLTPQDVLDLSSTDQLFVTGDSRTAIVSTGQGWVNGGLVTIDGVDYISYTARGATLFVETDIGSQFIL